MSLLTKIFGDPNEREIKKLSVLNEKINNLEREFEKIDKNNWPKKTAELKKRLKEREDLDDILAEAFALVREAGKKTLGQRHFDVQLMGGVVLHQGKIAEMKTGEGKTLCATLSAYLNALKGKGVHIVTVNDYLARRDTVWMGQIYYALGLSVSCLTHEEAFIYDPSFVVEEARDKERDLLGSFKIIQSFLRPVARQEAYRADITYGTNNEFGFDYLRDHLVSDKKEKVQRGFYYAIIDEIDNILIDEARTPLIISSPTEEAADLYYKLAGLVKNLREGEKTKEAEEKGDYIIDEKMRAVYLTQAGQKKMANWLGEDPWQTNNATLISHIESALLANSSLFRRNKEYIVKNNELLIVDEFTGRLMHGRRYSEGLHQALEAKEGLKVKEESKTLATITFQNYFRLYKKLAGMTGTAVTEAEEFKKIYNLDVIVIPTNKPMIRIDFPDLIYRTEAAKNKAIIEEIRKCYETGQPILVGTRSVEKNEFFSQLLKREGVSYQMLNAKQHEKEGQVIAQAGKLKAVTIATNMAGRGVDIVLGGNPPTEEEQEKVKSLGGLYVLGTERHEARRIDNQLRGRGGRQGDRGLSRFFISLEDDLMRIFGGSTLSSIMQTLKVPEDVPIESKMVANAVLKSQEKIEGYNFDIRKHLLEYDDVLNKQREKIYHWREKILEMDHQAMKKEIFEIVKEELKEIATLSPQEIILRIQKIFPLEEAQVNEVLRFAQDEPVTGSDEIFNFLSNLAEIAYQKLEENLKSKEKELYLSINEFLIQYEKGIVLRSLDYYWIDYLSVLENLKKGIGLRAYGQHDPLVEYKREAFGKFKQLQKIVRKQIVYTIYKVGLIRPSAEEKREIRLSGPEKTSNGSFLSAQKKIGRNDPCPCGKINPETGKPMKYKKCCWPKYG